MINVGEKLLTVEVIAAKDITVNDVTFHIVSPLVTTSYSSISGPPSALSNYVAVGFVTPLYVDQE